MRKLGKIPGRLGMILVCGFLAFLFLSMFKAPPKGSVELVKQLERLLEAAVLVSLGYHFNTKQEAE